MKKIFILIIPIYIFISSIVYTSQFFQAKSRHFDRLVTAGQTEASKKVVFSLCNKSEMETYQIIKYALDELRANIYIFDTTTVNGRIIYTKYIYFNDASLFNDIQLSSGRFFTNEERESDKYISTIITGNPNQIGQICKFSKDDYFQIATLKSGLMTNKNLLRKNIVLHLKTADDFIKFKNILQENDIAVNSSDYLSYSLDLSMYITIASIISVFVLLLIILYNLLNSYKKIAIEKMLGYSKFSIWSRRILPILAVQCICFLFLGIVCSLMFFDTLNIVIIRFLKDISLIYLLILTLTASFITIPFIYVKRIKITSMLKNMRPTKAIIKFNTIVKISLSIVLVITMSMAYFQVSLFFAHYNNKQKSWLKAQGYAFVPNLIIKDQNFRSLSDENLEKWKKAYLDFNANGAVLADFSNYTEAYKEERLRRPYYESNVITINPNYLKLFDILDENDKKIDISEKDDNYILLIPAKYKQQEKEIIKYNKFIKDGYKNLDIDDASQSQNHSKIVENVSIVFKQEIKIIWIKNNQEFFSFKLDINPQGNNYVTNPIVRVITQSNGDLIDYSNVAGTTSNPFQIKISDYENPNVDIKPIFEKYFDNNVVTFQAISIYDSINDQIDIANRILLFYTVIILILFAMIISIITQNVLNYYEQYKRRLAIQQFMGHKLKDKYLNYFVLLFSSWILIFVVSMIIRPNKETLLISLILLAIDLILSIVKLIANERKNTLKITKGQ